MDLTLALSPVTVSWCLEKQKQIDNVTEHDSRYLKLTIICWKNCDPRYLPMYLTLRRLKCTYNCQIYMHSRRNVVQLAEQLRVSLRVANLSFEPQRRSVGKIQIGCPPPTDGETDCGFLCLARHALNDVVQIILDSSFHGIQINQKSVSKWNRYCCSTHLETGVRYPGVRGDGEQVWGVQDRCWGTGNSAVMALYCIYY